MKRICAVLILCLLASTPLAHAAALGLAGGAAPSPLVPQSPAAFEALNLAWFIDVDCFAVGHVAGSTFYTPSALTTFTDASWGQTSATPFYADAAGDPLAIGFDLNFEVPLVVGTEFIAAGYLGGALVSNVSGLLTGVNAAGENIWYFEDQSLEWDPKGEVPEPASLLLLGTGVAAAGFARRFRRR